MQNNPWVVKFEDVGIENVPEVGGKNASLGEMYRTLVPKGVRVPGGFIVTAEAYRYFLKQTGLEAMIRRTLSDLNTKDLKNLAKRGKFIRDGMIAAKIPKELEMQILQYYERMEHQYGKNVDVAVRSSATAEDLPDASFAGEHETYLNIRGGANVIDAVKHAMASLFTDRAISYRVDKGFDHFQIALSCGVQKMVRSDKGCSGVMFTLDTESGFRDIIIVNGSWGLGEMIVQGEVTPDEFLISKKVLAKSMLPRAAGKALAPIISKKLGKKDRMMIYAKEKGVKATKVIPVPEKIRTQYVLNDLEVRELAEWGMIIEEHYSAHNNRWTPMDIEWAKDGTSNELYIVQARPETIHAHRDFSKITEYVRSGGNAGASGTGTAKAVLEGASVGNKIAAGKVHIIMNVKQANQFKKGEVLVTDMTDPDWEPIMKMASAIVTDKGGRTSHAAIVSRELGIPCIVGTGNATKQLKTGETVTVDTTGAMGMVFRGALPFKVVEHDVKNMPQPCTKIMVNIATPESAFQKSFLPNKGVGLAREEFIIASEIGIHPMALINYKKLPPKLRKQIDEKTHGVADKEDYYIRTLAYGIAKIAVAFDPNPVIVRFSDFKTNEYRTLMGGELYEPEEENPMLGWRGASRYYDPKFRPAFGLECKAIRIVREEMDLKNVIPMIPFCRTLDEADKVLAVMAEEGLSKKKDPDLKIYVMCEIPANVILAEQFLDRFDGMSIGSNDLTQLTLGLDRDSGIVTPIGNEKNDAVKELLKTVIKVCKNRGKYIGICGQGPSDYPDFAEFLVRSGIDSLSLNPDTVIATTLRIHEVEQQFGLAVRPEEMRPEAVRPEIKQANVEIKTEKPADSAPAAPQK
ncbi:MAG: phosphoenolpyruvate synthase [Candidatus Liptonbacteria bacterium]